jgi:hypothetical protein
MSIEQVSCERRAAQRFYVHVPLLLQVAGSEHRGFTENLSVRGAFFYTEIPLVSGNEIEMTLVMPFEISFAENLRVRCRSRVTRVVPVNRRFSVAVHLENYEFLPETGTSFEKLREFARISGLHKAAQEEKTEGMADAEILRPL